MSKFWKYKSSHLPILLAALLAMMLLASLQYHWVGQVSAGERERMQANLHAGALRFSEDFDREIARVYLNFQMDAATLRDRAWWRYSRRYSDWLSNAPYPGLVRDVFLVEINQIGGLSLSRFNTQKGGFETTMWPDDMVSVQQYFEQVYSTDVDDPALTLTGSFDPVAADVPALLIPLSRLYLLSDRQNLDIWADLIFSDTVLPQSLRSCPTCRSSEFAPLFGHTIVRLDRDYMEQVFIPDLVKRNFAAVDSAEYRMTIISAADPHRVVYQSDPESDSNKLKMSDAQVELFSVRFDELNRLLLATGSRAEDPSTKDVPKGERVTVGILGRVKTANGGTEPATLGKSLAHWHLLIQHRAGSLEAAVTALRLRNLIISFTILLILGASVVMMVLSTQRAQRLAKQQMDFAAAVSHELRTPLAVICAAGENLADGLINDLQKARQYGAVIRGEGWRLTEMVEQVLDFASAQSGQKTYQLHPVEVNGLVESALAACHVQLSEGGFVVEKQLLPDLPLIRADAAALRRSLQNLISNAIKYSGPSRWIGVRTRVQHTPQGPEVVIGVQDRGIGIAPADLPHIFEPFYRGQDVTAAQIHGSGLGLSLVKHAIDAHGGRISAESTLGMGVTFTLYLPALLAEAEMHPGIVAGQLKVRS